MSLTSKQRRLLELIAGFESCAVAFSAGVDSTLVAKAAQLALGDRAVAVTGVSASLADGELEQARSLAEQIGIRHVVIRTGEMGSADYTRNAPDRCYHCKTELYQQVAQRLGELGVAVVLNGANLDDRGDYRPGMQAASERAVRSPLLECGFTKDDVRALASVWQLPVWDKPASPCLASRIAYGEQVTADRLRMIDRAEQFLRRQGLTSVRVRYHKGDLARIEVAAGDIPRLCDVVVRQAVCAELKQLGFHFVSVDLEGFRSGSLNAVVPLESLNDPS